MTKAEEQGLPPVFGVRPLWSVMIPTFRPGAYLRETLASVLGQDPGPSQMQIEVVDDASEGDVRKLVMDIGGGRVGFTRNPERRGLVGNWNACLARSRGELVHILHQDDLVLPGFYQVMANGMQEHSDAVAGFCRHLYIDERGLWHFLSPIECEEAGVLPEWARRFAEGVSIQCPAVVVRREAYQHVGLYDDSFRYCADLEMWMRLACRGPIFFIPTVLAAWRMHGQSASRGLLDQDQDIVDGMALARRAEELHMPLEARHRRARLLGRVLENLRETLAHRDFVRSRRRIRLLKEVGGADRQTRRALLRMVALYGWARIRAAGCFTRGAGRLEDKGS